MITLILNYLTGIGILRKLGFRKHKVVLFGLAFPLGLGTATLLLFVYDLLGIRFNLLWLLVGLVLLTVLLFLPELKKFNFRSLLQEARTSFQPQKIRFSEWIFIFAIAGFFLISLWRTFYIPITPYDSIHGIDLVGKYAAEEGRLNSQMFSDLKDELTTQPYYAPFTALSQTIYRISGHSFGKIWLSFMFLSLLLVFYGILRREIHPVLTGFLTVVLISIPELYSYTFMVQTDFSNAVFVTLSVICLYQFLKDKEKKYFWLSAIFFGFGCWTRSETIAFAVMTAVLLWIFTYREKQLKSHWLALAFVAISFGLFAIWNFYYLPVVLHYAPASYFKFGFWDAQRFNELLSGMLAILTATAYWGYIFYFFLIVAAINLLFFRDRQNLFILVWLVLLFAAFFVLLYHLQLNINANIKYTFRRGSFKLWMVMVFYIGTSAVFRRLTLYLKNL